MTFQNRRAFQICVLTQIWNDASAATTLLLLTFFAVDESVEVSTWLIEVSNNYFWNFI